MAVCVNVCVGVWQGVGVNTRPFATVTDTDQSGGVVRVNGHDVNCKIKQFNVFLSMKSVTY